MLISAEERNKVKQSYQESLQNVATVRQQAAVSHLHSSVSSVHSVNFTVDVPVGQSTNPWEIFVIFTQEPATGY